MITRIGSIYINSSRLYNKKNKANKQKSYFYEFLVFLPHFLLKKIEVNKNNIRKKRNLEFHRQGLFVNIKKFLPLQVTISD